MATLTKKEIIERLLEWKENIDCDIKSDWIANETKNSLIRQSTQIAMAIGLLSTLGQNNNVPE